MKILSTLLALVLMLGGTSAMAQDEDSYEDDYRDILEVAIYGGLNMPMGGVTDWETETATGPISFGPKSGFLGGVELGYFATPSMVVGFQFQYSQYSIDSDLASAESRNHRVYSPALYLKYYFFGESDFVPYVRGHAGIDFLKFTTSVIDVPRGGVYEFRELSYDPTFAFGAGAGVFWYTHDYGGLFLEVNYHQNLAENATGSYEGLDYEFGENGGYLDIHAGIKVFFGSD